MKSVSTDRPIEILLVEDNPGDVHLLTQSLTDCKLTNNLSVVEDGSQAMAFLRNEGDYANAISPDLILLDLQLPIKNGHEVLAEIKEDNKLKDIPILIMTDSKDERSILKTFNLQANDYLTKPIDLEQFIWSLRLIDNFWFTVVKCPQRGEIAQ